MSEAENWFQFCSVSFSSDGLKKVEIFHFEQKMSWRKFSLAIFFSFPRNSNLPPFFAARCLLVGMKNVALRCRGSGYLGNAIYLAINYPSYKLDFAEQPLLLPPLFLRHKSSVWRGWWCRLSSRCHEKQFSSRCFRS